MCRYLCRPSAILRWASTSRCTIAGGARTICPCCTRIRSKTWSTTPRRCCKQNRLGIFTIGGGVPRNWAQQFGPFIELRHRRGGEDLPLKRYHYGVRICPEPVNWGGLSGCTYSEAVSWGKFVPTEEGGKFGEVFAGCDRGLAADCGGGAGEAERQGLGVRG